MSEFTKEAADFLHKVIDGLNHGERLLQDLHTELSTLTKTPEAPTVTEGSDNPDAQE